MRSDFPAMRPYAEEALAIWRGLGQDGRSGLAYTLGALGDLAIEEGDYALAPVLLQEALDIYRELDDGRGIGVTLMLFGWAAMRTGDYTQAAAHLAEFLALAKQAGDIVYTAFALSGLGEVAVRQGHYERAAALLEESLRLNRAAGYRWSVGTVLGTLGWVALIQHDYARMRASWARAWRCGWKRAIRAALPGAWRNWRRVPSFEGQTATVSARRERYQTAVRIFGAAAGLRAPIKSVIDPADQPAYERNLATLRTGLGEPAFATAWTEGAAMAIEAVVACALAEPAT